MSTSLRSGPGSITKMKSSREWLLLGGGGHEDGADGLRALSVSGEGLVEFLDRYAEYVLDQAYLVARGGDRFEELGTRQLYWNGRCDAANEIRRMKGEVAS
jgi:hypothetical protein